MGRGGGEGIPQVTQSMTCFMRQFLKHEVVNEVVLHVLQLSTEVKNESRNLRNKLVEMCKTWLERMSSTSIDEGASTGS